MTAFRKGLLCLVNGSSAEKSANRISLLARSFQASASVWQEETSVGPQNQAGKTDTADPPRRRKLRRRDLGSYASAGQAFDEEIEGTGLVWPDNRPAYDIATQMEFYTDPNVQFTAMDELAKAVEENDVQQLTRILADDVPNLLSFKEAIRDSEQGLHAGRDAILHWEVNMVLHTGPDGDPHPIDKKVKCMLHLRDLQQAAKLSDQALRHIALICGPRYDASSGRLNLVSSRYDDREANRRDIVRIIHMLIEAGHAHIGDQTDSATLLTKQQHANA